MKTLYYILFRYSVCITDVNLWTGFELVHQCKSKTVEADGGRSTHA